MKEQTRTNRMYYSVVKTKQNMDEKKETVFDNSMFQMHMTFDSLLTVLLRLNIFEIYYNPLI